MAFPFENVLVLQLPGIIFCINRFSITKLSPLQNLNLGFFLKLFLRFRKFQPRHSYKTYSYRKKKSVPSDINVRTINRVKVATNVKQYTETEELILSHHQRSLLRYS